MPDGPLIIQGDMTILVEIAHPQYEEARDKISPFTEIVKSPEHIHTYAISHLSLWNAASAGHSSEEVMESLEQYSRYDIPPNVVSEIRSFMDRYGRVRLMREDDQLILETDDPLLLKEILLHKQTGQHIQEKIDDTRALVKPFARGFIKQGLTEVGFPAEDLAGYRLGAPLEVTLRKKTTQGEILNLRDYQKEAVQIFHAGGSEKGGSGVVVLPCGAGKTVVGMAAMVNCGTHTLILTTNVTAAKQWIREILDKTNLKPEQISEYTGSSKSISQVTVATYQIITYRKRKSQDYPHFDLFQRKEWGLIIYDEVHLLPAPVFRISAEMQATRRLGLTATLVREDGKQKDVFSLIGPKKYDVPWKDLEKQGWIATATCTEVRIPLPVSARMTYAMANLREKVTMASSNPLKLDVTAELVQKHKGDRIMVIGQYLDQLDQFADKLNAPIITGSTKANEREELFGKFRTGALDVLVVSKVGNFAVDIPDANVLIQISGAFGSRQEEAQRLGRLLRPKKNGALAHFYTVVTKETREQDFAMNRQLFLTEQGYRYEIKEWES